MAGIVFLLLKILGITLLSLAALILLLVLAALFVPVRYQVSGSFQETLQGRILLTWLLHLISLKLEYGEDGFSYRVRVLGLKLFPRKKKAAPDSSSPAGREKEKEFRQDEEAQRAKQAPAKEASVKEAGKEEKKRHSRESEPEPEASPKSRKRRIRRFFEKLKFSILSFCDKLKHMKDSAGKAAQWLGDEKNQASLKFLMGQLKKLLAHIFPRKGQGEVVFGFEDPWSTGQVLTWISPFYPLYADVIQVHPVFGENVFTCSGKLSGRVRLANLLWLAFQVYRDKHTWKMLRKLKG